jgi:glyoxylase-like metal-dependent hydrolase (beta-lactamase superfamily II)
MEIRPGIHLYATRMVNSYICIDEDGVTLVDASTPNQRDAILNYLEKLGYRPQDVRRIVVTHADYDHVGSLADLQAATQARVYAGAETAKLIAEGKSPAHLPRLAQFITDRFMRYRPVPEAVIQVLVPDDSLPVLGGLTAIPSPGHTPDHFSFYSAQAGVLFAGDALNNRGGKLGLTPQRITADMDAAQESGRTLLKLAPALIACGHGSPAENHDLGDLMSLLQTIK